jgi:hypothetical protein
MSIILGTIAYRENLMLINQGCLKVEESLKIVIVRPTFLDGQHLHRTVFGAEQVSNFHPIK